MARENWNKEQIKKMLQENDFSYQNIELPYGLSTGGTDRSSTAKKIFPADMAGKSVKSMRKRLGSAHTIRTGSPTRKPSRETMWWFP
jgi:hypothetical protein